MRALLLIILLMATNVVHASAPLPSQKPTANNFESILEKASQKEQEIPRLPKQLSLEKLSIITPPALPDRKRTTSSPLRAETAIMIDGVPVPEGKPLAIRTTQIQPVPLEQNVIPYQGSIDDRTAGIGSTRTIERTLAKRAPRIIETSEKSPFKTAQLPRASKLSTHDPVIIFFEEKTSELEVGQLDILKSDIINILKRSPSLKIAVYGYAESDRNNPDKTNQLSLARALLISEYLADNNISVDRIEARSMGDDTPISPKNRVDAVIF